MRPAEPPAPGEKPTSVELRDYEEIEGELLEVRVADEGLEVVLLVRGVETVVRLVVPAREARKVKRGLDRHPRLTRVSLLKTDRARYEVVWWANTHEPPKVLVSGMVSPRFLRALMKYKEAKGLPSVSQALGRIAEEWLQDAEKRELSSSGTPEAPKAGDEKDTR